MLMCSLLPWVFLRPCPPRERTHKRQGELKIAHESPLTIQTPMLPNEVVSVLEKKGRFFYIKVRKRETERERERQRELREGMRV